MVTQEHISIDSANVHTPYRWSWTNETARLAQTGLLVGDELKIGFQKSDNTTWVLIDFDAEEDADKWKRLDAFANEHSSLEKEDVHRPYRWEFADQAARDAIGTSDVTADDIGKVAIQEDPVRSLWSLTNNDPVTWKKVDGEPWRWVVADETALNALTPATDDLYRLALVMDTNTVYVRLASSWVKINNNFSDSVDKVVHISGNFTPGSSALSEIAAETEITVAVHLVRFPANHKLVIRRGSWYASTNNDTRIRIVKNTLPATTDDELWYGAAYDGLGLDSADVELYNNTGGTIPSNNFVLNIKIKNTNLTTADSTLARSWEFMLVFVPNT